MTSSHARSAATIAPYGGIFEQLPGDPQVDAELSDGAFVRAVMEFESVVTRVQAERGVIPQEAADVVAQAAARLDFDTAGIGARAAESATPIIAIVEALREAAGKPLSSFVHHGLTSQDCIDSAFSIMQGKALDVIGPQVATVIGRLSRLAEAHAATPMLARTLGQPAAPITFGWKVCSWIEHLERAVGELGRVREELAVQIGGAAGDLAAMGEDPQVIVAEVAAALELAAPTAPWHTERSRVLSAAAACVQTINAAAKIAGDVASLATLEAGELTLGNDPAQSERGGSSAMPHKRNPAAAVLIRSAATAAPGLLATIAAAGVQEHERAAGAWQAEWRAIRDLVHLAGGAVHELALLVDDVAPDPRRMAENLRRAGVPGSPAAAQRQAARYLQRFQ